MTGWFTLGASEPASTMKSSNGCDAASNPLPLDPPPQRTSRFGAPLVLSRTHWVRLKLVVEVKYLAWTDDNLPRQLVYDGLREDKPAAEGRRPVPHRKPVASARPLARSKRHRLGGTDGAVSGQLGHSWAYN
jgi:bifunctional non-homologous end joining protein LigD